MVRTVQFAFGASPPPTALELNLGSAATKSRRSRCAQAEVPLAHYNRAQFAVDQRQWEQALLELNLATTVGIADTLEGAAIEEAKSILRALRRDEGQYHSLCEAANIAIKDGKYAEAMNHFETAAALKPEHSEALAGLALATELEHSDRASKQIRVAAVDVAFVPSSTSTSSSQQDESFAFLLTQSKPVLATSGSDLSVTFRLDPPQSFPSEMESQICLSLVEMADGARVASVNLPTSAIRSGLKLTASPLLSGWKAGSYTASAAIITPHGLEKIGEPYTFSIGLLQWQRKSLVLTPDALFQNDFSLSTGIKLAHGDALSIIAKGTVTPSRLKFYRELLDDPKLSKPVPADSRGLAWSRDNRRMKKYHLVNGAANYAALLMKTNDSEWLPYSTDAELCPVAITGELQLTLNSVVPVNAVGDATRAAAKAYWQSQGGALEVTICRGEFSFAETLSFEKRKEVLKIFSTERSGRAKVAALPATSAEG